MSRNYFTRIDNSTHFPDTIKVQEYKAPTDESIRLLNEMEEKARKNIIAKISVEDNTLNGVLLFYADGMQTAMMDEYSIYLKFKVNGKEYNFQEKVKKSDINYDFKRERWLLNFFQDRLKAQIAEVIFYHLGEPIIKLIKEY